MRYPKVKEGEFKTLNFPSLSFGIDVNDTASKQKRFSYEKNFWYKDGKLTVRPGISALEETLIEEIANVPFTITETSVFIDGEHKKIAYYSTDDDILSCETLHVVLVSKDGTLTPFGVMGFNYLYNNLRPVSALFFTGEPTFYEGYYAFVLAKGDNNYYKGFVYERAGSGLFWQEISNNERYIPTVYENGMGVFCPDEMKTTPTYPEKRNAISPFFKCKFTTDGYSSRFKLPVSPINGEDKINCKVYTSRNQYTEFVTSPLVRGGGYIGELYYTCGCDFDTGEITFYRDGMESPLPQIVGLKNNLVVVASEHFDYGDRMVTCSKYLLHYNSRYYFFGNPVYPNSGYYSRPENPLYFPVNGKVSVGAEDAVTAIGAQNDKLIVFKKGEIYKVGNSPANATNDFDSSISYFSQGYFPTDKMTSQSVSTLVGCLSQKTVAYCAGRLLWLGNDRKIYTLETTTYGSEKNIFYISGGIDKLLESLPDSDFSEEKLCAFCKDGFYFLLVGNKLFVCDCKIREFGFPEKYANFDTKSAVSWHYWELPENSKYSFSVIDGKVVAAIVDRENMVQYIAVLNEDGQDVLPDKTVKTEAEAIIERLDFNAPEERKIIESATLTVDCADTIQISLKGQRHEKSLKENEIKTPKTVLLKYSGVPENNLYFSVKTKGKAFLKGLKIKYKTVK